MQTKQDNNNVISAKTTKCSRTSKTGCKFTQFFGANELPESVSVCLDWLSLMVICFIQEPEQGEVMRHINDDIILEYCGHGTPIFKHSYKIYVGGEFVANIHTHGKTEKIIKPDICKLEIANHVLYANWIDTYNDILTGLKIQSVQNVSRLDIAIDGANNVPKLLNLYAKQTASRQYVKMIGKANFDAKRLDKTTMLYNNFKVGSSGKQISVYCKSRELEHSHKEYIRETWRRAGMDTEAEQWRTELRLGSQAIKEIKGIKKSGVGEDGQPLEDIFLPGIEIENLISPHYLLQLFRTQINNFFEFVKVETDSNISRSKKIDLFQFRKLSVTLLDKLPRAIVRGAYKAKMSIHNAIMCVLLNCYQGKEAVIDALNHVGDNIQLYNLERFYAKKLPEWIENYQNHNTDDDILSRLLLLRT